MPTCSSLQLERVVDVLLSSRTDDDDGPVLVHVVATDDGFDLGVKPVDGHPSNHLLGFVAPDHWDAVGVLAGGWVSPAGGGRPSRHPRRSRMSSAVLVGRDGQVAAKVTTDAGVLLDTPPESGLLLDCLQRVLGLPTPPPEVPTAHYFALDWMRRIEAAGAGRRSVDWAQASSLHLASLLLAADGEAPDCGRLVEWASALARVCDWPELRWRAVESGWLAPAVTPTLAAWMDDGMLARWVCPPGALAAATSAAATVLTPRAGRELRRVLRRICPTEGSEC